MPSVEKVSRTDSGLASALRISVARLSRRLRSERDPENELLPVGQLSVLGALNRFGEHTVGELAALERVQPPSMTRIVALLEAKELVRLEPHRDDRRQKVVTQTEQATAMLDESRRKRNAFLASLVEGLDEDEWAKIRAAAPVLEKLAHL